MELKILVETNMGTLPIFIITARTLLEQFWITYWYTTNFIETASWQAMELISNSLHYDLVYLNKYKPSQMGVTITLIRNTCYEYPRCDSVNDGIEPVNKKLKSEVYSSWENCLVSSNAIYIHVMSARLYTS
jgi:hypothetical protein